MIVRVVRRHDVVHAVVQQRGPLVGLAADEAVELVEAAAGRPAVGRPEGLTSQAAVSWLLPKAAVAKPFSRSISASGATRFGRCPVCPGKAVAISTTAPMLHMWWLRPVSSAARVGEQSAVV